MLSYVMMTLAVYLHRMDPYAIMLWEGGPIRWYGLSYLAGFLVAYWLVRRVTRVGQSTLQPERAGDLVVAVAVGLVVGGRLGYVLFYRIDLLWEFYGSMPFWGLLAINEGGMASHGGIIGGIITTRWFARRHGHSWPHMLDFMAFAAGPGLFFGRVANFINGELLGRRCSPDLPWAVKFPQELYQWDPTRLEKLLHFFEQQGIVGMPFFSYDLPAWVMQRLYGHPQSDKICEILVNTPLLPHRHPSQIYAGLLEGLLVFLVLALIWIKPRKPLVVGAAYCTTYSLVRIFDEQFREPDAHIGLQWLGLTRGQWLSVLLLIAGLILLWIFSRRDVKPMGGWWTKRTEG